ncbi:MAG: phosphatase PAP2 family protein [Clostridia bacterium]|nr:phosphatase PAP2 family protein [Clostridia bacterium]
MKIKSVKTLYNMIKTDYKHAFLLIYWAVFGILFWAMELMPGREYFSVSSPIDAMIPFNEWFLFAYFFWFIYIIGDIIFFFFKDREIFVKYMLYVIITYTLTLIVYAIFPTSQPLRPELTGDGFLISVTKWLYGYDTNTNVCPSIHVIGSFNVMFAALHSKNIKGVILKVLYVVACVLISLSTVFVKQHSIIDVFWGVIVALLVYPFVFKDNIFVRKIIDYFKAPEREKV